MIIFGATGIPCEIDPGMLGCGGLAEAWPWVVGVFLVALIPALLLVVVLRWRDR